MSEGPKRDDEFDISDLDATPPEGRAVHEKAAQDALDHAALVEVGKRLSALEMRMNAVEKLEDDDRRLIRRLRKLMASWISD